jgi:hypothetical protein
MIIKQQPQGFTNPKTVVYSGAVSAHSDHPQKRDRIHLDKPEITGYKDICAVLNYRNKVTSVIH